ncbi:MAG: EAL domain-containing protein [Treponema sp.]|nr:EAL domain-containing protein [Treponema sp.]
MRKVCNIIKRSKYIFSLIVFFASYFFVFAEISTVRIGFYDSVNLFERKSDSQFSGFYYEYLEAVSNHTNWHYEYIHYDNFDECYERFLSGDFEIMCGLPYTKERANKSIFSSFHVGQQPVMILCRNDDFRFTYGDYSLLNEKKVGYLTYSVSEDKLKDFAQEMNLNCRFIIYPNQDKLLQALNNNELDLIIMNYNDPSLNLNVVADLPSLYIQFAVLPQNINLLSKLDSVIVRIKRYNSSLERYLTEKYFQSFDKQLFSKDELQFINSNPEIVMIYFYRPPMEYKNENGDFAGIIRDVMNKIEDLSGLKFTFVYYDSEKMHLFSDYIHNKYEGENVIIASVYDSIWSKRYNIAQTQFFLSVPMIEILRPLAFKAERVAMTEMAPVPNKVLKRIDSNSVRFFSTFEGCITSLIREENDYTLTNMFEADYFLRQKPYRSLKFNTITDIDQKICLGIFKPANPVLFSILEKVIFNISSGEISDIVAQHTNVIDIADYRSFAYINAVQVAIFVLGVIIVLCLIFIVVLSIKNSMEKKQNIKLEYRANHDLLTGLWNKSKFFRETRKMLDKNKGTKYVIMVTDIERFKIINDQFGVETGDALLRYIARHMKENFNNNATHGYLEADHFVCCFPKNDTDFKLWNQQFDSYLNDFTHDFKIIAYLGLYIIDETEINVNLMCDRARLALRTIKGNYLQRYAYYDSKLRDQLVSEQKIINEMNKALLNHEFIVYLQPQYNHLSGELIGAEALVRWKHPILGLISPAQFIPVFEENGFISKLDEYVWELVCQILKSWRERDIELIPISVNISRRDIYNPRLPDILLALVKKYQIPIKYLRLEITESVYVENPKQLIETVKLLQQMHFSVEMDDFGSGYSSLNTLKDVPVDILKLDLKFLSGSENAARGGNILNSVVRMAKWLNLPVIAEGVETLAQADYLKSIGCFYVQGYLYSPPIPLDEFERMKEKSTHSIKSKVMNKNIAFSIDELWNPDAPASKIFNNFINAFCLFEFQDGNVEVLRANDKFYEEIGISQEEFESIRMYIKKIVIPDDYDVFFEMIKNAIETGKEEDAFVRWKIPEKDRDGLTLHIRIQMIASSGGRYMFLASLFDVTNFIEKKAPTN